MHLNKSYIFQGVLTSHSQTVHVDQNSSSSSDHVSVSQMMTHLTSSSVPQSGAGPSLSSVSPALQHGTSGSGAAPTEVCSEVKPFFT